MMGLLVLLKEHGGSDDVARLADDLDLEIDEILPALDYAEVLGFVKVSDGHAMMTELGTRLLNVSIRERKSTIRDRLQTTTLFKTIVRALDGAPERRLSEEEVLRLIAFTTAPADELVQNIVNWGRFAELFRFDSDARVLLPVRRATASRTPASSPKPPASGGGARRPPSVSKREPPTVEASSEPPSPLAGVAS